MMERTVVMVRPEQRHKLDKLAADAQVSAVEINRRAIDAYNPNTEDDNALEQLALVTLQSRQKAIQALKEAHKILKETLSQLQKGKEHHGN